LYDLDVTGYDEGAAPDGAAPSFWFDIAVYQLVPTAVDASVPEHFAPVGSPP
jgi:hypothetical protein